MKFILPALIALTVNANAQCYDPNGFPCTGAALDTYQQQQDQLQDQQDQQLQYEQDIINLQSQLNQIQADQ